MTVMRGAILLALLVPLAAGCGAKESGLAGSDQALKDAGSSRIEMTMASEDGFSATGSIDYARDRGELVITSKGVEIPGGKMYGRFIGRTSYFGFTLLGKQRWQKEADYEPSGTDRFIPGPGGPNPDRLLGLLIKSSTEVETLETEEIRGVPARHYRAHLDKKKLGDDASYLPKDVVIDAWIDEDGLVRRVRVPQTDGAEPTIIDLFDFGVEVDVEAPPAAEIVTEEELFKLMEKECRQMPVEKRRNSFFCDEAIAFGSEGGSVETVPVEPK